MRENACVADHDAWRLELAGVADPNLAAGALRRAAKPGVTVTRTDDLIRIYAPTREAIEALRLGERPFAIDCPLALDRWDDERETWVRVSARRWRDRWDDDEPFFTRRERLALVAVAAVCAAVGIVWYAQSPGVASYNASSLLLLPLTLAALAWLNQRLPGWLQWALAVAAAAVGAGGYAIVQDEQWWNWGQFAAVPLLLLIMRRQSSRDDAAPPVVADGPWGPPP